ncbi:MAG: cellulase family glycosylhydrolase [Clostridia bacterium]|nr:cellulase family glycosylhydrolase [Clostridia bacterium]
MKRFRILLLCATLISAMLFGGMTVPAMAADNGVMRDMTSAQLMGEISIGCNLGNTLDSVWIGTGKPPSAYETGWGNPVTTKAMIQAYKDMGFTAMRIPVTWFEQMGAAPNYTVNSAWMNRVEEVVNYVLDCGMYCILNTHHEQVWLNTGKDVNVTKAQFTALWTQIANRFKNYGDKLIFEGFNEILKKESDWSEPSAKDYANCNTLAQAFVDTVRATGGNNAKRHLVVSVYGALHTQKALNAFVVPTDSVKNRLIVSVHNYDPQPFCWNGVSWAADRTDWGTDSDKAAIEGMLNTIAQRFAKDNIPVLLGEFGSENKKGNSAARARHAAYVVSEAKQRGITCFWWDNGGEYTGVSSYTGFGLLDRNKVQPIFTEVSQAIVQAAGDPVIFVPATIKEQTDLTVVGENDNKTVNGFTIGATAGSIGPKDGSIMIEFYSGNTKVASIDKIATGMVMKLIKGGQVTDSATVILYGDVTGDGDVSAPDLLQIKRHLLSISSLSGHYLLAGKITKGDTITAADLLKMKRTLLSLDSIAQ